MQGTDKRQRRSTVVMGRIAAALAVAAALIAGTLPATPAHAAPPAPTATTAAAPRYGAQGSYTAWRRAVAAKSDQARREATNSTATYLNYGTTKTIFGSSYIGQAREFAAGFSMGGGHLRNISASESAKVTAIISKYRNQPNPNVAARAVCNGESKIETGSGRSHLYDDPAHSVMPYTYKRQYMTDCEYSDWIAFKDMTAGVACGLLAGVIPPPLGLFAGAICATAVFVSHQHMEACRESGEDGSVILTTKSWQDPRTGEFYYKFWCSPQDPKPLP